MKSTSSRSEARFEVAIVGGGVAGAAAAIHLARDGWRVTVLNRRDNRDGLESIPPPAAAALDELSLQVGAPLTELISWWGSAHAKTQRYIGARIISRLELAESLRGRAVEAGAIRFDAVRQLSVEKAADGWIIDFVSGSGSNHVLRAKYAIDASGQASIVGKRAGAQRQHSDDLYAASGALRAPEISGVWTESVEDGWWNLCCANGVGTATFFGERGVVRSASQRLGAHFSSTRHLSKLIQSQFARVVVRSCGSSRLCPSAGDGWVAVGDAAASFHPLASAGVARALRDARFLTKMLRGRMVEYDRAQELEFRRYQQALRRQYLMEGRWPKSSFWSNMAVALRLSQGDSNS